MKFAIVDIETTGGSAHESGITEVAVLVHDGNRVLDSFHSLVNPGQPIPAYITRLTGISSDMVEHAPLFGDIAQELYEMIAPCVFVAHNVNFDFSFLNEAFKAHGLELNKKNRLCTVRMARQAFPGHASYSLGNICTTLGISITDRHRAMGDAQATAILFGKILAEDAGIVPRMLHGKSKEATLPPNVPRELFDNLPWETGVYYFHDAEGKIIYIGKAVEIRQRIYSHFTGSRGSKLLFLQEIHDITYQVTGSELAALLLESDEIKKHFPKYNKAQKIGAKAYGLYDYTDQTSVRRLLIAKKMSQITPSLFFTTFEEARSYMFQLIEAYTLCPKCCGIETTVGACYSYQLQKCNGVCCNQEPVDIYNERVEEALNDARSTMGDQLIIDKGRHLQEKCVVVIQQGIYKGFGYIDNETALMQVEDALDHITPYADNTDVQRILRSWQGA